jgi:hypothetical protein
MPRRGYLFVEDKKRKVLPGKGYPPPYYGDLIMTLVGATKR